MDEFRKGLVTIDLTKEHCGSENTGVIETRLRNTNSSYDYTFETAFKRLVVTAIVRKDCKSL